MQMQRCKEALCKSIIGHEQKKQQVELATEAAKIRNVPIPHMILSGRPGCGKTTMSRAIAQYAEADLFEISATSLKTAVSVKDLLMRLSDEGYDKNGKLVGSIKQQVVFIDEAHRVSSRAQETLGIAMEERRVVDPVDNITYWTPHFTVIIATTDPGALTKPFVDRFLIDFHFDFYSDEEMFRIAGGHLSKLGMSASKEAVESIARRSRGTPRILVSFINRIADVAAIEKSTHVDRQMVDSVFELLGVDENGVTARDKKTLTALRSGPIGIDSLCQMTGEARDTMASIIEPFLLRKRFINITSRGRRLTAEGERYIGKGEASRRIVTNAI